MSPRRAARAIACAAAIGALVVGTVVAPRAAGAQTQPRVPWIGYLANEPTPDAMPVLRQGLRELGWIERQHLRIWYRYAQGRFDLFPGQVDELVRLGVNVLVAASPPAIEAARRATRTIPIVMVTTDDPVANGLVAVPGPTRSGVRRRPHRKPGDWKHSLCARSGGFTPQKLLSRPPPYPAASTAWRASS